MRHVEYLFFLIVSRFVAWLSRAEHLYKARLAHFHELTEHYIPTWQITKKSVSIILAEGAHGQLICVKPSAEQKELGNILLKGKTRIGKGVNIMANYLRWMFPLVTNDIKQEFWKKTAGWRGSEEGLNGKALKFDPRGYGCKFDPLEGSETEFDLQSAATILLYRPNEGENQIFTDTAITMLTQVFLAARLEEKDAKETGRSFDRPLPFAYKIMNEGLYGAATILEIISAKHNYYPNLATTFLDATYDNADFKSEFLYDCWNTLTRRLRRILTKETVRCFMGSDFTPKDIITSGAHPLSVYLCWPEKDLLTLSPLIELVWDTLINGMTDAYDNLNGVGCYPSLVGLDEIFRSGMRKLPDYVTTVCGRNISMLVSCQNTSQMDAAYGAFKANVLRGQFDSVIVHPPAPADYQTMVFIQQLMGDTSGFAHSKSEHGEETSTGESEQRIPLLPSYESELLKKTEVIVKRSGTRATITRKLDYRRFPELFRRSNIPPPSPPPLSEVMAEAPLVHPSEPGASPFALVGRRLRQLRENRHRDPRETL